FEGEVMKLYRYFQVIALFFFSFIITACGTSEPPASELPPLEIAVDAWPGFMPVVLAAELGYFEEEGVEVKYVFNESSRQQRLEFEGGGYDGITLALGSFIAVSAEAPDTRVVMLSDISTTGDAVVVRSEIESIADLKGKSIVLGAAGYGEVVVSTMLQQAGLSGDDVIWVAMQNENEALEMLKDGRVDAFQTWEPFVTRAVQDGAKVIFTGADVPGLIPDAVGFHERVLLERPEDVKAFMRGWFRAVDYWLANPEAATRLLSEAVGLSPEELSIDGMELLTLEQNRQFFEPGNDFSSIYYAAQVYLDFFVRKGVIDAPLDVNTLIDASFIYALP
ncbi:MAG TPA: hypothetical protein DEH22_01645, partial [Chloroflexi bacterium]|nr:hypothetical protein [Chloroflexota bacterium]